MSQNLLRDPYLVSGPTRTGTGNGTLALEKATHFTTEQTYTFTCISTSPDTVFSVVGSLDGPVGLAVVGQQFFDADLKIFVTIQQGAIAFVVGDQFTFHIHNGTDLNQDNIDLYDELPQKNFGVGIKGQLKGDNNIRYSSAAMAATLQLQGLLYTAAAAGAAGNALQIQYLEHVSGTFAALVRDSLTFTAVAEGTSGNGISIEFENFTPSTKALLTIQNVKYTAQVFGTAGNAYRVRYTTGATAGAEVVSVTGTDITVQIASGASTANQIITAVNASAPAFALVNASLQGSNVAQTGPVGYTPLSGAADAIGAAGSEVVTVTGSAIKVKLQTGVSTALQVKTKLDASGFATALITTTVSGSSSTVQTAPSGPTSLAGGTNGVGFTAPSLTVTTNLIQIYFRSAVHTATQIKAAYDVVSAATAKAVLSIVGSAAAPQFAPVAATNLSGGLNHAFSLNQNELTVPGTFSEGNASVNVQDVTAKGKISAAQGGKISGPLALSDVNSGPAVGNTQLQLARMVSEGKLTVAGTGGAPVRYTSGSVILYNNLLIHFRDTGIINTVVGGTYALTSGQSLYVELDPTQANTLTPVVATTMPTTPNSFRLVTRVGTRAIWYNGAITGEQDVTRIGGAVDYKAHVFGVLTGGGTVSHSVTTVGLLNWTSPIQLNQVGSTGVVTIPTGSVQLADGQVAYVELDDDFVTATKTASIASLTASDLARVDRYWLFYRNGTLIYVRSGGTITPGEESTIGQTISDDIYTYMGSAGETDNDPEYSTADGGVISNRYVTDGDNLTKSIKRLDTRVGSDADRIAQDRNWSLIEGGTWAWNFTTKTLSWSSAAYISAPGMTKERNTITAGSSTMTTDGDCLYVNISRVSGGTSTDAVVSTSINTLSAGDAAFIIARRIGNRVVIGGTTILDSDESNTLHKDSTAFLKVGSAAAPSLTFQGDTDTGAYHVAADVFGFATGGVLRGSFRANGNLRLETPTASTVPYLDANKEIVSSAVTPTELGYVSGVTSSIQAQINALAGGAFGGFADGTGALPSAYFTNDTDTGMWRPGTDTIGWSTGGSERMRLTSQALQIGTTSSLLGTARVDILHNHSLTGVNTAGLSIVNRNNGGSTNGNQFGAFIRASRTISASVTDTLEIEGIRVDGDFTIPTGTVLTNASSPGYSGFYWAGTNAVSGTYAYTNFSAFQVMSDSTNTGTNKFGLRIGDLSGATNNYAIDTGLGLVRFGDEVRYKGTTLGTYVGFKAAAAPANYTMTWPSAAPTASGQVMVSGGSGSSTMAWASAPTPTYTAPTVQKFTGAGAGTYTKSAGVLYIRLRMVGGGGGGGGTGGGGATGGTGGTSSFTSGANTHTATGGLGGGPTTGSNTIGGLGGAAGSSTIATGGAGLAVNGSDGGTGLGNSSPSVAGLSGYGGQNTLGGGGSSVSALTTGGAAKTNSGGGGAGAGGGVGAAGGGGGGGGGYLDIVITSPAATCLYTVGASGGGGAGGSVGGAGAVGYVEVTEYYQ